MLALVEAIRSKCRAFVRPVYRRNFRGKTRLRQFFDPLLAPAGGEEALQIGDTTVWLRHDSEATRNMAYLSYERAELIAVSTIVNSGDIVLDVGANVGYFAAHLAQAVGAKGKVVAVEPGPTPLRYLHRVAASNSHGTIEVVEGAVSDRNGNADFYETENIISKGYGRIDREPSDKFDHVEKFEVAVFTIPSLLNDQDVRRLSFVKLDVEGQEIQAIRGMIPLFEMDCVPAILTEVTVVGRHLDDLNAIAEILGGFGYRMYRPGNLSNPVGVSELNDGFHGNVIWLNDARGLS